MYVCAIKKRAEVGARRAGVSFLPRILMDGIGKVSTHTSARENFIYIYARGSR